MNSMKQPLTIFDTNYYTIYTNIHFANLLIFRFILIFIVRLHVFLVTKYVEYFFLKEEKPPTM